ncbi:deoxyribose-phosphate aldolase [Leptobacterium flavescens]|uniref:Deoxyribose-phosphate aldolase n=1 Tax=Leptobacterium flavescens TaxID=472055 RepID=A0A6P0UIY2_9FLAO|nr:DUF6503 family protein [Leptobacterium flavescens]NER13331.1 deoxyribose-phosphate aldolase [Leptobacterium flavescens]
MRSYLSLIGILLFVVSCKNKEENTTPDTALTANEIINRSIEVAGGENYKKADIAFGFRGRKYTATRTKAGKEMTRITEDNESGSVIKDVLLSDSFKRYIDDEQVEVADSMAVRYSNSVNSVHYFAYLPQGLNDKAVNKELLGEEKLKEVPYYKIRVSFDQEGGGTDFEDVFIYWVNKETFKIDYLAYEYHVDGGGLRLREAYNERYVGNLRFVDYNNYKPKDKNTKVEDLGHALEQEGLQLLSKIELTDIEVN